MSDTEKRITAKYILDSTGFNSSMKGINAALRNNQSELKFASNQVDAFGRKNKDLKVVQEELAKRMELHAKKVDIYKDSIEKATEKMNKNIAERDKLKNSLDQAKTKYENAVKVYGKESEMARNAKEEVDRLKEEHEKAEKAVENNAKSIQNYENSLNKANADMVKTEGQLNKISAELDKNNNKWLNASNNLKSASEKFNKTGETISKAGDGLLKMNAPLVATGAAALKVSADFESGMSEVQAVSGATGSDLQKLSDKAKEMGAKTKFSASESADALKYMAMAGWKTNDMLDGLAGIMNLAAASGEDLGTTSDIVTDDLTAFGLAAKDSGHFADIMASASSNANTNVSMMGESFQYCASTCGSMKYSAEDTSIAIGLMANAGIKGSQAGNTLKNAIVNMVKPTDAMQGVMDKYGLSLKDSEGKMKSLREVMDMLREKMGKLSEAEKSNAAATLFGKESMAGMLSIINASPSDYEKLTNAIDNCDGTSKKMADTMNNNMKGQLTLLKSQLEGVGIQLGKTLLPIAKDALTVISKWVDAFSKLSPKTQENIVKLIALGTATGGVLKVVGGVITSGGKVLGLLSKATGALGLGTAATTAAGTAAAGAGTATAGLGAGLASVCAAALPWVAVAGGVAAAGYGIYKVMSKEATPAVDLFADRTEQTTKRVKDANGQMQTVVVNTTHKIATETKKQVGEYMKLDDQATKKLQDLYVNSTKITSKQATDMTNTYKKMGSSIKQSLDKQSQDQINSLKNLFANSKNISTKEQQQMLDNIKNNNNKKKKEIDNYEKQIKEIMDKASKEKRELTLDEQNKINSIQDKMRVNAVKSKSKEEKDTEAILSRLKGYSTRITTEQASTEIKNAEKARSNTVKKANDKYNQTVKAIKKLRDESGSITKEQADKMIKEAERQRKETVKKANDMKTSVVDKIKKMNSETANNVDTNTGDILTCWDKLKRWWDNWHPVRKLFSIDTNSTNDSVFFSGFNKVSHNATGTSSFKGGLTTLHENGYELYDLPSKTRIYNHEASESLVKQTAADVAESVLKNFNNSPQATVQNVTIPIYLGGKQVDEYIYNVANNKLALSGRRVR